MIYFFFFILAVLILVLILASVQFYNIVFRGFAPFISTKFEAVLTILKDLDLKGSECIYELGSGKAGFLRAVEQRFGNKKLIGVEYSFFPYILAKIQIALSGSFIKIIRKDMFKINLKEADIIYCFLSPEMMIKLEKKFKTECRPGTLVISYHFKLPNFEPERILKEDNDNIYFYRI